MDHDSIFPKIIEFQQMFYMTLLQSFKKQVNRILKVNGNTYEVRKKMTRMAHNRQIVLFTLRSLNKSEARKINVNKKKKRKNKEAKRKQKQNQGNYSNFLFFWNFIVVYPIQDRLFPSTVIFSRNDST